MIINENTAFYLSMGAVAALIIISWFGATVVSYVFSPHSANATSVTITASITATITCNTNVASTDFGALTSSAVATSTPNASTSIACANAGSGCTINVVDAGSGSNPGLWNSTSSALIESSNAAYNATSTLAAGTEGYGIRATTTSVGAGGALMIALRYNTGLTNGLLGSVNNVGGLSLTTLTIASSTSAITTAREIVVTHKAAVATDTPGGNYNDTITYGCIAN